MNALDVFANARPEVSELDDELRADIAAEVFDGHRRRSPNAGKWRALGVAAAVVALIVGLTAVVGRPDSTAPGDTVPPAIPEESEPLALLPGDVAQYGLTGRVRERWSDPHGPYIVIARPNGQGGFSDPISVSRAVRDERAIKGIGTAVDFEAGGRQMQFVEDVSTGYRLVMLDVGDGTTVFLVGSRQGPAGTLRDELASVALALDLASRELVLTAVPDGSVVLAQGRYTDELMRSLDAQRADGPYFSVSSFASSDPSFPFVAMGERIRPETIRGRSGWVTTSTWHGSAGPFDHPTLIWEERPDQWVQVSGSEDVTFDELIAFAESLRVVTADDWDRVVELEGTAGVPATTAPAPQSTPPTTSQVLPGSVPPTTAPVVAPSGSLLIGNASGVGGLAGQTATRLEAMGIGVLEPTNASASNGGVLMTSRLFVRPGAEALGEWLAANFGLTPEPIDGVGEVMVDGDVDAVDVVLVLGFDRAAVVMTSPAPVVVGDSVTQGAAAVLAERGYTVNAEVSRLVPDVLPWIGDLASAPGLEALVLQLGTNGPIDPDDFDQLLTAVAGVPNVIIVNVYADRSWADANNRLIADRDRDGDNLIVLDWNTLAEQCPGDCFADDGIHLTAIGARYFADRLQEITGI